MFLLEPVKKGVICDFKSTGLNTGYDPIINGCVHYSSIHIVPKLEELSYKSMNIPNHPLIEQISHTHEFSKGTSVLLPMFSYFNPRQ